MLKVSNLSKAFQIEGKSHQILKSINLEVDAGIAVSILGKSGSGKSTLLSALSGIINSDDGDILYDDTNFSSLSMEEKTKFRMNNIGFIFQDFKLVTHLTVLENVLLPLELKNIPNREEIARMTLEKVGLEGRLNAYPATLSGGEKQRVAMARSMGMSAKLILADEPNANLDIETGNYVIDYLFKLKDELQQTLLLVTHDEQLAKRCDRTYVLENGVLNLQ